MWPSSIIQIRHGVLQQPADDVHFVARGVLSRRLPYVRKRPKFPHEGVHLHQLFLRYMESCPPCLLASILKLYIGSYLEMHNVFLFFGNSDNFRRVLV